MKQETRIGLYLTIIVHLLALIGFLAYQITTLSRKESAFMIDFTKQEAQEAQVLKEMRHAQLEAEVEELISGVQRQSRNVAVDATQRTRALRDDRHANPNEVYDEAKELQRKLDAARKAVEDEQGLEEAGVPTQKKKEKEKVKAYTGPAVLEYKLTGRKAMSLPIPVYKCLGGGDVTILIQVDQKGYVKHAAVAASFSSQDRCLQEFAVRAALQSRFTASTDAPSLQEGEIVYRFIPQ